MPPTSPFLLKSFPFSHKDLLRIAARWKILMWKCDCNCVDHFLSSYTYKCSEIFLYALSFDVSTSVVISEWHVVQLLHLTVFVSVIDQSTSWLRPCCICFAVVVFFAMVINNRNNFVCFVVCFIGPDCWVICEQLLLPCRRLSYKALQLLSSFLLSNPAVFD